MYLGDITVGDPNADTVTDTNAPVVGTNPLLTLAANLSNAIIPIKQGVPVNVAIAPQTQSFLLMGGALLAGLLVLNMVRR
jgi:hypothetical protein